MTGISRNFSMSIFVGGGASLPRRRQSRARHGDFACIDAWSTWCALSEGCLRCTPALSNRFADCSSPKSRTLRSTPSRPISTTGPCSALDRDGCTINARSRRLIVDQTNNLISPPFQDTASGPPFPCFPTRWAAPMTNRQFPAASMLLCSPRSFSPGAKMHKPTGRKSVGTKGRSEGFRMVAMS